jgi:hypothetical protein
VADVARREVRLNEVAVVRLLARNGNPITKKK